jgi:probable rRNA maturation factor
MAVLVDNLQKKVIVPAELLLLLDEIGVFLLQMEDYPPASEISIVLADNRFIQELNASYRGHDTPTDVLSFCLQDDSLGKNSDYILGDVVISMEKAREQAQDFGHSLTREVAFLTAHGILHLMGYNHDTFEAEGVMKEKQDRVMAQFKL